MSRLANFDGMSLDHDSLDRIAANGNNKPPSIDQGPRLRRDAATPSDDRERHAG